MLALLPMNFSDHGSTASFTRRNFLHSATGGLAALSGIGGLTKVSAAAGLTASAKDDGYRGIWFTLGQVSEFGDKYSGGLGTYTANHVPMAIYAREVDKTFFVYGGAKGGQRHLLCMASHYDHREHRVPRPTIVHDKQGVDDPHDNPSLCIDGSGHVWVFVSGRAKKRPGYIYRSTEPYSTDAFEQVAEREFTYPQPRWVEGQGFVLLFTKYTKGRELYFSTSPDGRTWSPDTRFAGMGGHYQTSHQSGNRIITAFNMHPGGDVNQRTNLYYLQTDDFGRTWCNGEGEAVDLPLIKAANSALVRDYRAEKRLVYIHDLDLDENGQPVILYVTSADHRPGKFGDPRWWTIAKRVADKWQFTDVAPANHNYSTGSLYLSTERGDRIIGPIEKGPQPIGSGGEIAIWQCNEKGGTWSKQRDVTSRSRMNHNYVRRPLHAHDDFYSFWADGNPDQFSPSHLYFSNADGSKVWRLPYEMKSEFAEPEVWRPYPG